MVSRGARALSLARFFLPRAFSDRAQDQLFARRDRTAALRVVARPLSRLAGAEKLFLAARPFQLRASLQRYALSRFLSAKLADRGDFDRDPASRRLPDRLRHGAGARTMAPAT